MADAASSQLILIRTRKLYGNLCMVKARIHKYLQVTLLWGVNKDMDLFETVRDQLGCEYISDMRSCRALLNDAKKVVASLDLEAYTAWELADMAEYLYGKKMYGAEKDIIISFLKKVS